MLDLYEIPCPGGAVRLYVDAYHCGPGVDTNVDPDNLTDEQLERMARLFRQLETAPFEDRARKLRTEGFAWLGTTDQLQVLLCQGMLNGIVGSGYEHEDMLVEQLGLSVAAATIEISDDPKNRAQVTISGIQGVVRLYRAILQHRGAPASNPRMDDLGRMLADGSIRPYIDRVLAACQASRRQQRQAQGSPRMQMQTDEGNVWPPQGPGCDELVRCCESTGLVADGGSKGPEGLMCLLGAAPPTDCEGALETLRTMGTDCGSD